MVTPGMYHTNIDLLDMFLTIPMSTAASSYFKFSFKGRLFKFIVLPFGYTGSPKIFTKILRPLLAYLRHKALLVSFYLDDSWQGGDTYNKALNCCLQTFSILQRCGFIPNLRKSQLVPKQVLEILGNIVDSINMCVRLPQRKEDSVLHLLAHSLQQWSMSIRHLARIIGKLISCTVACPLGNAYYRNLECLKVKALHAHNFNWNAKIRLDKKAKSDLLWWMSNIKGCCASYYSQQSYKNSLQ